MDLQMRQLRQLHHELGVSLGQVALTRLLVCASLQTRNKHNKEKHGGQGGYAATDKAEPPNEGDSSSYE